MSNDKMIEQDEELSTTKAILELTKNKLFTAVSTITELEFLLLREREKNQKLSELIDSIQNKDSGS